MNRVVSVVRPFAPGDFARLVCRHALGWLVAANLVGGLIAALLLWPALGDGLAPFTYGRWMPLHLDWQLYGWCALPLAGALLGWYLDWSHDARRVHASLAFRGWSLALLVGGIAWLSGTTSGKLFLDWHGWARPVLPAAMLLLWSVLAIHARRRRQQGTRTERTARIALLVLLAPVPFLLYWAAGREVFPSANPHSGGATGASLLGSTLGIIAIFGLLPLLLRVPWMGSAVARKRWWAAWVASGGAYAILDHGDASHHALGQILGLGTLLAWIPLLFWYARRHEWSAGSRRWLRAAAVWWALLVLSGWLVFLPGLSERLKFTNALVGHAHLAMAGLVTSVNFVILNQLDRTRDLRAGFWLWQGGCAVHVAVLFGAGWFERDAAGDFFGHADWVQWAYGVRFAAGLAMAAGSLRALGSALRSPRRQRTDDAAAIATGAIDASDGRAATTARGNAGTDTPPASPSERSHVAPANGPPGEPT